MSSLTRRNSGFESDRHKKVRNQMRSFLRKKADQPPKLQTQIPGQEGGIAGEYSIKRADHEKTRSAPPKINQSKQTATPSRNKPRLSHATARATSKIKTYAIFPPTILVASVIGGNKPVRQHSRGPMWTLWRAALQRRGDAQLQL